MQTKNYRRLNKQVDTRKEKEKEKSKNTYHIGCDETRQTILIIRIRSINEYDKLTYFRAGVPSRASASLYFRVSYKPWNINTVCTT